MKRLLLQELQDILLRGVRLLDRSETGLLQDVELRHVRGHRRDVGVLNVVLSAGQVLDLCILNV